MAILSVALFESIPPPPPRCNSAWMPSCRPAHCLAPAPFNSDVQTSRACTVFTTKIR